MLAFHKVDKGIEISTTLHLTYDSKVTSGHGYSAGSADEDQLRARVYSGNLQFFFS